ncbi:MAG TPA: GEVED domain-containing protein, partial [Kiritimatiellia bacterium]|nr:GEVED domain-containing protein [Kiritimatiellia bacterium]
EHVYVNQPLLPGLNALPLNVPIPPALNPGGPHSRWRFTTYPVGAPTFTGLESDGEVEDYEVHLEVLDFGDAPSPYPTCLSADGARHRVPSGYWLGPNPPDHDPDGQPHPQALGDDLNGIADEDGVTLAGSMVQGGNAVMTIQASTNTGYLSAWVDFNQNGSWLDAGEQIVTNRLLATGFNVVTAAVPANATLGQTFARFRYSSVTGLAPTGLAPNGEVEDYAVTIWQRGPSAALVITNILYAPASDTMTIQWPGEAAVTYEAEYSAMNLPDTNIIWTPWGGYVTSAPYQQIDATPAETTKFYRVVAPHAPPPP